MIQMRFVKDRSFLTASGRVGRSPRTEKAGPKGDYSPLRDQAGTIRNRNCEVAATSRECSVPTGHQDRFQKRRPSGVEVPATVLKFRPREIDPFAGIEAMNYIDVPPKRRVPKQQW